MSEYSSNQETSKHPTDTDHGATAVGAVSVQHLRLWPLIVLLICLWGLRIGAGLVEELSFPVMMARFMAPLGFAGLIVLWWIFLSRATVKEKATGVLGLAIIALVTSVAADKTVRGFGTMMYAVPWGITAFSVALILFAGAVLLADRATLRGSQVPIATRMDGVKFKRMVRPGDTVEIHAKLKDQVSNAYFMTGKMTVNGKLAVRLDFACSVASTTTADPAEEGS